MTEREQMKELMLLEIEEIKKHKWIESEKAGYDLGLSAELDWIKKHAKKFREEHS